MLNWNKCSEKMPDNPNSIKNNCLVRTIHDTYFFAYYSIHLNMWRRIEVPHRLDMKKIIDEIVKPEEITHWISFDELKVEENESEKNS